MLIESQQGGVHWQRARPFLEAGLPCYIDKPFTCSVADARKLVSLAEQKKVSIFSSSSLRYAPIWYGSWPSRSMEEFSAPWLMARPRCTILTRVFITMASTRLKCFAP